MKILLGVSGGLDSSFSAFKLIGEGHEVVGAILVMHENPEIDSAREVCDSFGIPLVVLDVREKFENTVVRNFIDEYRVARTPNPCVICNSEVKFRALYDYAMENGFDAIATGHYASVVSLSDGKEERYAISRSCDTGKDQTYVLWRLSQDILSKLIFPLSNMKKSEVRELAKISGIKSAEKKESQEAQARYNARLYYQRWEPDEEE